MMIHGNLHMIIVADFGGNLAGFLWFYLLLHKFHFLTAARMLLELLDP